jgi:hypothetical protein
MPFWKPHALAKPHEGQIDLRIGDEVVTTVELPDVPIGSKGRVILANGFQWQRYWVRFANGAEVSDLDHRHLAPLGRAKRRLAKAAKRAR